MRALTLCLLYADVLYAFFRLENLTVAMTRSEFGALRSAELCIFLIDVKVVSVLTEGTKSHCTSVRSFELQSNNKHGGTLKFARSSCSDSMPTMAASRSYVQRTRSSVSVVKKLDRLRRHAVVFHSGEPRDGRLRWVLVKHWSRI